MNKKEYMREWRLRNKERIQEYIRKYKQENREHVLAVQRLLNHRKYMPRPRIRKPKPEPTRPKPQPRPKIIITNGILIQF